MRSSSVCSGSIGTRRPHVEAEAAEVHRPHDVREILDHERVRRRAVGRADDRRREPLGRVVGDALLEERLSFGAVRVALHEHRASAHRAHHRLGDGEVVVDEVELGLVALGEQDLARAGDADGVPVDVELDRVAVARHELDPNLGQAQIRRPGRCGASASELEGRRSKPHSGVVPRKSPLDRLRALCMALPEVTERLSHGSPTWFIAGKKTFLTYRRRPSRRRDPRVLVRGAARRAAGAGE